MSEESSPPVVFISYSHNDSDEHKKSVRGLGASLSRDGCDCRLDVHKESDDDWPIWMERQLKSASFILCAVTKNYKSRFNDEEQWDEGLGVGWEAGLIRRCLYSNKFKNKKIFPIFFVPSDRNNIPLLLQGYDLFYLGEGGGYHKLLRKIHDKPLYNKPTIGEKPTFATENIEPTFSRSIVNSSSKKELGCRPEEFSSLEYKKFRKEQQGRQFSIMVDSIRNKDNVLKEFSKSLSYVAGNLIESVDGEVLVDAFNDLSDNDGIQCVTKIYQSLNRGGDRNNIKSLGAFAEAWLPVLYEHHNKISSITKQLNDSSIAMVSVPTRLSVPTEITMAEADGRLLALELTARNELVSHLNLGCFGELGLDEDGKEQQQQLYELLSRKFSTIMDKSKFERSVHGVVRAICRMDDSQGELANIREEDELRNRLGSILEGLYELDGRRYYCCITSGEGVDESTFKQLKEYYPTLAFLVNSCEDESGEAKLYRNLTKIIVAAKSGNIRK